MNKEETKQYLNEKSLGCFLQEMYQTDFIHDKTIPNSNSRLRPDYRNDDLKLIVEFDGYGHYTNPQVIINDIKKDNLCKELGYAVIRIPYFVQLSPNTIKHLFNIDYKYTQTYKHGFIDKKAVLPASYCELGIEKFKKDLYKFDYIKDDIIQSLKEIKKDNLVKLPKSLLHLINT